ncbi:guanine nucleotide-binding protein subunit beta-like protein 1 [Elysia marginata]|uniref:Guanine nucleotide-binding protein subunit beta-like protein 1 n=1 Tax=Elysia marginata TaxID=1093978 RepID=A0AAV4FDI8_9GAST|nr:guanine nucleotide-binding protein subunit beta-like protein 1 [Elysia marginata]
MSKAPPPPDPVMELCGSSPVTSLVFGNLTRADKKIMLFSGHQNGKVLCWDLKSQRILTCLNSHTETVLWIANPKLDILITQGREGVLKIWTEAHSDWKLLETITTAAFIFCNSSILDLKDHNLLFVPAEDSATVSNHHLLTDFTLDCGHSLQQFTPTPQREHGMCMKICTFHLKDNASRLLVAYEGGSLILWDVKSCAILSRLQAHSESIMCLDISMTKDPHVYRAVTGSVDTDLKSWLISHDTLAPDHSMALTNPGVGSLALRQDGRIVVSGGWDGLCRMFTAARLRPLAVLSHHKETIQCVVFSTYNRLAAGSKDGYITLWDVYVDK